MPGPTKGIAKQLDKTLLDLQGTSVQLATAKEPEEGASGNGTTVTSLPLAEVTHPLLRLAIEQRADIATIERMVAMMKEERAYQAEKEFNEALNAAQTEIERVAPDKDNKQTNSRYASYAALSRMVKPIYTKHGFSLSFDEEDSPKADHVRVVALLSRGGHTRKYHKDICADGKGAKGGDVMTRTHAEGAADSYGMRYLLKKIFDIAIGEEDDDGNLMPENQERDFILAIEGAGNLPELERAYKDSIKAAVANQDYKACDVFKHARDKRESELRK